MIFAFSLVFLGFMFTQPAQGASCNCNEYTVAECDAVNTKQAANAYCKKENNACVNKECTDYKAQPCPSQCYWKGATSFCQAKASDCAGYTFDAATITKELCESVNCILDGTKCKKFLCSEQLEGTCATSGCLWVNSACKDSTCANQPDQTKCEAAFCKWTAPSCAEKTCADQATCDGSSVDGKICNADTTCTGVAQDSDCAVFKGEKACKAGSKTCKWASPACSQGDCTNVDVTRCENARFFNIGGTATICKKSGTACAVGVAGDLTETTCSINNGYKYAWKDGSCQECASAKEDPEGGNATIFALGVLSIMALSF